MKKINKIGMPLVALLLFTTFVQATTAKIVFATKPFSGNPSPQTEFKITDRIYAKLILDKAFKEYCGPKFYDLKDHYGIKNKSVARVMSFRLKFKNTEGEFETSSYIPIQLCLTKEDLEKKEIFFDVNPTKEDATSLYNMGGEFFRVLLETDFAGTKREYRLDIDDNNETLNGISGFELDAPFTIDYSASTSEQLSELFDYGRKAQENAETNSLKATVTASYETVKQFALPLCFSKGKNVGYKNPENSNAKIIAMIKQKYGITEVLNLTFDKPDGVEDYRSLVDANSNIPSCKMGNHVFYFAFKDKDGSFRFSGGTLRKDYEGYGKYGETYIQNYSPIQEGDPKFPLDVVRENQGTYGVFVFDGTKLAAVK